MSDSGILQDSFVGGSIILSAPEADRNDTGATISCQSNYDQGYIYSRVKPTPFTGDDAANAAEIKADGEMQSGSISPSRVISGQDPDTPYYVGWYQDEIDPAPTEYNFSFLTGTAGFTFSRADTATGQVAPKSDGVLISRTTDEELHPWADWDGSSYSNTSGLSEGILLEDGSTRYNPYTGDFINGAKWNNTNCIVDATKILAPDGTVSAENITFSAEGSNIIDWSGTAAATASFWLKGVAGETISIRCAETIVQHTLTSEWARYSTTDLTTGIIISLTRETGDTATSVDVWHAQHESQVFMTSEILGGEGAAVTRVATVFSQTLATLGAPNFVNTYKATLTATLNFGDTDTGDKLLLTLGTVTNGLQLKVNGSTFTLTRYVSGVGTATTATSAYNYGAVKVIEIKTSSAVGLSIDVDGATGNNPDGTDLAAAATVCVMEPGSQIVDNLILSASV